MKFSKKRKIGLVLLSLAMCACVTAAGCSASKVSGYNDSKAGSTLTNLTNKDISGTQYYGDFDKVSENYASEYIMVRNRPMAGSFYAYTEGITDDMANLEADQGNESVFWPGSQLVKLSYVPGSNVPVETLLIDSEEGVIRDPDVSPDGTKVVFSWKRNRNADDYHLYIYYLEDGYYEQITFGQGISDMEPKWLPNGKLVFSSSRIIQVVDCWHTPVSNLYICNEDGSDMIRVGYDQVHTTYPTVTEDGRVLYTRWDYNDRTQMFVQALFSMNTDGTGQTAVFGNNSNNPTTLMHTVGIPGAPNKYITIVSGHHVVQGGKIAYIDTSVDRDGKAPLTYIHETPSDNGESVDELGAQGVIYRYPYAINEYEMFYARADAWGGNKNEGAANTLFTYYYYNARTGDELPIATCDGGKISCSQLVPIRTRNIIARPETADYSQTTGTYYVADVYEGLKMEEPKMVQRGDVKYLRVVALDYRPYAIGGVSAGNQGDGYYHDGYGSSDPSTPVGTANAAWDVKQVIGIVDVESDGSVMFECPSDVPVYFQLLDKNGLMIQSMRSWSTLMPGETFSCVGCHESKNNVPVGSGKITLAMKKGTQQLKKDLWMTTDDYEDYDPYTDYAGFSYTKEVQPILDASCIVCHTNTNEALNRLQAGSATNYGDAVTGEDWKYIITTKTANVGAWQSATFTPDSSWSTGKNPFGGNYSTGWGASDDACFYMTQKFNISEELLSKADKFYVMFKYDEDPVIYINGNKVLDWSDKGGKYNDGGYTDSFRIDKSVLKVGENVITARAFNAVGGSIMDVNVTYTMPAGESSPIPVSLKGDDIAKVGTYGGRDRVNYLLSYLVLTNSYLARNEFYAANMDNNTITNWIGGMSEPHAIPAYKYGSTQSNLINMFFDSKNEKNMDFDHSQLFSEEGYTAADGKTYKISKEDLMRIAAWIDLAVPFRGAYDEATESWGTAQMAERERRQNMRDYYTKIDELNKAKLAGKFTKNKVIIEYYGADGAYIDSVDDRHLSILNIKDRRMQPGDKIVVYLPKGYDYIWFNLNPKMEISLQYCPDGKFTYIVPSYAEWVLPSLMVEANESGYNRDRNEYVYTQPTITAFLPTEDEIYNTTYNVALNPYDLPYNYDAVDQDGNPVYLNYDASNDGTPRITTGSTWEGNSVGNFYPANAFDGICNNRAEGEGRMDQSWGPSLYKDNKHTEGDYEDPNNLWLKVDFGREVTLESFVLYIRAYGFGSHEHDTWFTELEIEYGNGETITWDEEKGLAKTNQAMTLKLDGSITTTYLKITIKAKADPNKWCGITEFEAYGRNVK